MSDEETEEAPERAPPQQQVEPAPDNALEAVSLLRGVPELAANRTSRNLLLLDPSVVPSSDHGAVHLLAIVQHAASDARARAHLIDRATLIAGPDTALGRGLKEGLKTHLDALAASAPASSGLPATATPPTIETSAAGKRYMVAWSRRLRAFNTLRVPDGWRTGVEIDGKPADPSQELDTTPVLRLRRARLTRQTKYVLKLYRSGASSGEGPVIEETIHVVPFWHHLVAWLSVFVFLVVAALGTWIATLMEAAQTVPWSTFGAVLGPLLILAPFQKLRARLADLWITNRLLIGATFAATAVLVWLATYSTQVAVRGAATSARHGASDWPPLQWQSVNNTIFADETCLSTRSDAKWTTREGCELELAESGAAPLPFRLFGITSRTLNEICKTPDRVYEYRRVVSCNRQALEFTYFSGKTERKGEIDAHAGWELSTTVERSDFLPFYEAARASQPSDALLWRVGPEKDDILAQSTDTIFGSLSVPSTIRRIEWWEESPSRHKLCERDPRKLEIVIDQAKLEATGAKIGRPLVRFQLGKSLAKLPGPVRLSADSTSQESDVSDPRPARFVWLLDVFGTGEDPVPATLGSTPVRLCLVCAGPERESCTLEGVRDGKSFDAEKQAYVPFTRCG